MNNSLSEREPTSSLFSNNNFSSELRLCKEEIVAINERKQEYKALINNINIGIIKHAKDGRIIFSNSAALEMLGLTEDELLGKTSIDPSWNVIHEDGTDYPGNTHPITIVIATEKAVKNAIMGVFRPKRMDRVWLLVNAEPQFDSVGFFLNVFVTFTDITNYKALQSDLSFKNNILNSISEFSLDIILVIDEHANHVYLSKSTSTISGYSNEELMQINALDLVPIIDRQAIKEVLYNTRNTGNQQNLLGKIICKDGSIKYISWSLQWDNKAKLIYVNGRDKTEEVENAKWLEFKRVNDERKIKQTLIETEEQKRTDIGYELHENVSQIIATVKMYLDIYENDKSDYILQESKDLLSLCISELRNISYLNVLPKFNEVGFKNSIELLLQLLLAKNNIAYKVNASFNELLFTEYNKINIYRIIHLWVEHICKKDKVESVLIDILVEENTLTLTILDTLQEPNNFIDDKSTDLIPIKERVNLLGGTISILPSLDYKRSTLLIILPLEGKNFLN